MCPLSWRPHRFRQSVQKASLVGTMMAVNCSLHASTIPLSLRLQLLSQSLPTPLPSFCCGPCAILYPQASLLHWPVQHINTWCDSIRSSLKDTPKRRHLGMRIPHSQCWIPPFFQKAMGLDPEIGGEDALDNDGNLRAPFTRPPHDGTYAVAQDGFVLLVYPFSIPKSTC